MAEGTSSVLAAISDELASAVERAGKSVVTVNARRRLPATGIVWKDGVIVTADHVVERDEDITVILPGGKEAAATLAGRDPGSDLAVLKVNEGSFSAATLAPAESVKVGHFVLALGQTGNERLMASFGVVSALGSSWRTARGGVVDGYIRADLVFYPGFSGGPLVDTSGRVAGLNSSHLAQGQGLAIPASAVDSIVQTLLTQGSIKRGYLGITSRPVRLPDNLRQKLGVEQEGGLLIMGVETDSPADKGGLIMGDVVIGLAGQTVADPQDLQASLTPATVGQATEIVIARGGERQTLSVTPTGRD
jgi:S1-C subfamily serine protease